MRGRLDTVTRDSSDGTWSADLVLHPQDPVLRGMRTLTAAAATFALLSDAPVDIEDVVDLSLDQSGLGSWLLRLIGEIPPFDAGTVSEAVLQTWSESGGRLALPANTALRVLRHGWSGL